MQKTLLLLTFFAVLIVKAQSGNTIINAVNLDGKTSNLEVLNGKLSISGLKPTCNETDVDFFYKHTIGPNDNKLNLALLNVSNVLIDINFQVLKAPEGNIKKIEEVYCDRGNFTYSIKNVTPGDVYYIRLFKPKASMFLNTLLSKTSISMLSTFDASLAAKSNDSVDLKIITLFNELKIVNKLNTVKSYKVYNINGHLVLSDASLNTIKSIDISTLNKGVYVLHLKSEEGENAVKFLKQ